MSKGIYNRKCRKCEQLYKRNPDDFYMPNQYKLSENEE